MVDSAQNRTRVWLEEYITAGNILKDDDVTPSPGITQYEKLPYPLRRLFFDDKDLDWIMSISQARSTPSDVDWDGTILGYNEKVDVTINTVSKSDVSGDLLLEKCEAELRRVLEEHPLGSYRSFTSTIPSTKDMGNWRMWGVTYTLTHERDTS